MPQLAPHTLLSSEWARRRFWLRPPEPTPQQLMGRPGEGLYLGRTQMLHVPVFWDFRALANPHLAVVGMTGSGKSYFVKALISRANRQWGTHALILDWAGEYAPWVNATGGKVVKLGKEHALNLLDCRPPSGAKLHASSSSPHTRIEQVLSALCILTDLSSHPRQQRLTKQALESAFQKRRLPLQKPLSARLPSSRLPTLRNALDILKKQAKKQGRRQKDEALESSIFRLEGFCAKGTDYFSKSGGIQLGDLIGQGLVAVDLSGLPSEAHRSLAGLTLLQFLKERMREEGWKSKKGLRLLVVADEAWKIAQDDSSDLVAIVREGRKYAFGLIVASQNPTDLSPTILSNAGTTVSFRLALHEHREQLRRSFNCPAHLTDEMEHFSVGQALVRLAFEHPGDFDGPFIISRIDGEELQLKWKLAALEVSHMEIELNREDFSKRLWRLGCSDAQIAQVADAFERSDRTLQAEELCRLLTAFGLSRSVILSFLRGVGVQDEDLLKLFSHLQARSLGVRAHEVAQLVLSEEGKPTNKHGKSRGVNL